MMKKAEIGIFTPKECPHRCSRFDALWTDTKNVDEKVYYVCDHIKNTNKKPIVCDDDKNFPEDCVLEDYVWTKEV